jgi:hypothetical protein
MRVVLAILVLVCGVAAAEQIQRSVMVADPVADATCAQARGYEIKAAWKDELTQRLPELQEMWKTEGTKMFAAAARITGWQLQPPGSVRLTLCDTPSQSFTGPSVNMRFALKSFTPTPVPLRYKVDTAFHESLHPYIARHVGASAVLDRYGREPQCVRDHLHLLALQKAVLKSLEEKIELQDVIRIDGELPSGCYKRAWSIVDGPGDVYSELLTELRSR